MVEGVFLRLAGVVGGSDDLSVLRHDRAHRHFAQRSGLPGLFQRRAHQLKIGHPIPLSASRAANTRQLFIICNALPGHTLFAFRAAQPKMSPMPSA